MLTRGGARRIGRFIVLTAHAWLGLIAFDLALFAGFSRVHARLRRHCPRRRSPSWAAADDIIWAVDEACVWYVKRAACLQRSAIATWLLRRHGVAAELVIGCRPLPFESHAWVEVDGHIVNDQPQYRKYFSVLDRF